MVILWLLSSNDPLNEAFNLQLSVWHLGISGFSRFFFHGSGPFFGGGELIILIDQPENWGVFP